MKKKQPIPEINKDTLLIMKALNKLNIIQKRFIIDAIIYLKTKPEIETKKDQ